MQRGSCSVKEPSIAQKSICKSVQIHTSTLYHSTLSNYCIPIHYYQTTVYQSLQSDYRIPIANYHTTVYLSVSSAQCLDRVGNGEVLLVWATCDYRLRVRLRKIKDQSNNLRSANPRPLTSFPSIIASTNVPMTQRVFT